MKFYFFNGWNEPLTEQLEKVGKVPSPNVSPIYNLTLFSLVKPSHYVVDLEVFTYFCNFYVHADFSELKSFKILKVYTKYTAVPLSYVYPP